MLINASSFIHFALAIAFAAIGRAILSGTRNALLYDTLNSIRNENDFLSENPIKLNLNSWAVIQRVQFRIAKTNLFIGASYVFFTTDNSVDTIAGRPIINQGLNKLAGRSTLSMIQPVINWDSRNNTFTCC